MNRFSLLGCSSLSLLTLGLLVACGGDDDAGGGGGGGAAATGGVDSGSGAASGGAGSGASTSGGAANGSGGDASSGGGASGGGMASGGSGAASGGAGSCLEGTCQGTCEGTTCGGEWICNTEQGACTSDLRQYCGCDGKTFEDSSSCPSKAYEKRGACDGGGTATTKSCDVSKVRCRQLPPTCPKNFEYAEVKDACWTGVCLAVAECGCTKNAECPDPQMIDETFCIARTGQCSPQL